MNSQMQVSEEYLQLDVHYQCCSLFHLHYAFVHEVKLNEDTKGQEKGI
jgi:hypothetical protein